MLLKNDGLLPLPRDPLKSAAVIGPLANEAFTDWYSGTPPYRITPLQGVQAKAGDRNVRFHTGLDQVRLRSAVSGTYVALSSEEQGILLAGTSASADAAVFERNDWGWGSVTLRLVSSGKFVTETETGLQAAADEARGWFVKEAFGFEALADGSFMMKTGKANRSCSMSMAGLLLAPSRKRARRLPSKRFRTASLKPLQRQHRLKPPSSSWETARSLTARKRSTVPTSPFRLLSRL